MAGLYDEKIVGLKEQRDLARRLREQASAPAEMGQMVSGWYVPNYGNAITNALRNIVGGYQERQADEELKGIEQERGRAMIDALAQGGMKVPQSMLTQYGQKAQEPSFIDKSIAFLRGQEAPKATPAQAYQPNVNVNATPDDKEAAMYQALMISPEGSAPFINLYTASENRKATQAEKEYNRAWEQQKFAAEQTARKENAQENRNFRREMADIAAGNRQPSQPFGIETINGQPVRVNKITGEVQAVNIPGMAGQQGLGQFKYDSGSDQWVSPPTAENPAGLVTPSSGKVAALQNFHDIASELITTENQKGEKVPGIIAKTPTGGFMGLKQYTAQAMNKEQSDLFDNSVARLNTELRKIFRIPGEGALSDKEQAQYGLTLPSKKFDPSVNEQIMQGLDRQVKNAVYPKGMTAGAPLNRFSQETQKTNYGKPPEGAVTRVEE
jgi:hypothetical protein